MRKTEMEGSISSAGISRREFLWRTGALAGAGFCARNLAAETIHSPFRVAVINDEITQDFERACQVAAQDFGMEWIELRGMWNKNIVNLDEKEIAESKRILAKYNLRVTDIASPLFKADWPDAPKSKFSPKGTQFDADFTLDQQDEVLDRSIAVAKAFGTDRVRCFDFWRLENPTLYREAINARLLEAASHAGKSGITLVLENDPSCNTATGAEAAKVLAEIQSPHLMLNWDPGNATDAGEKAYPDGYALLPKNRIGHCHCKDAARIPGTDKYKWAAMGTGIIDWVGQFRALKSDGYRFAVSLETHWRGAGTAEASSRQSWAGMLKELQEAGAA